jgi:signal transduction histidine kinase
MDSRTSPVSGVDKPVVAGAALFERLAEPYLVLDSRLSVVSANAVWCTLFGSGGPVDPDAGTALPADRQCEQLIRTLAGNLRVGESRLSPVFRLDVKVEVEDGAVWQHRHWQVYASFLPATPDEAPLITLRFDDVTTRAFADEAERCEKARIDSHSRLQPIPAREAEYRLNDYASQCEKALAVAGLGVWEIDVATGGIDCSRQCLRDLGIQQPADITKERLLGGRPENVAANWSALESGQPLEIEQKVTLSDGHRWVLVRGTGRFHEHGTMQSVIGFTLDITTRKEHEAELDALANTERSARERSEALARTMDQFIAAVSHELRSPLNAIVSWAELLGLASGPANVARAGEAIRRNGRQLAHMVDDLLDSGAIATGKLSVSLQPVDLGALAAIVAEDMRKPAHHKGIQLRAFDISPCVVMADESRIKQVLWNLLTNAVKFTDAGSVDLSVRVGDDHAEMTVRDTGRGIDPDALTLVFDRFQQIAPQSSGRIGGLGLGLWLVKHIVTLHGGTIVAASEGRGCGAIFTVRLPLAVTSSN